MNNKKEHYFTRWKAGLSYLNLSYDKLELIVFIFNQISGHFRAIVIITQWQTVSICHQTFTQITNEDTDKIVKLSWFLYSFSLVLCNPSPLLHMF